jgi:hypothetical protein
MYMSINILEIYLKFFRVGVLSSKSWFLEGGNKKRAYTRFAFVRKNFHEKEKA